MITKLLTGLILILIVFIGANLVFTKIHDSRFQIPAIPTAFNPFPYKIPTVQNKRSYLTYLVGDSITEALGQNADGLRQDLIKYYPSHEFVNYNYGFGSTNILSVMDRLTRETTYKGSKFPPILKQGFDLIIIESFAYNPLSQNTPGEGLKNYEVALDNAVKLIIQTHPDAVLALMTPIAPNSENFAKYNYNLSPEQRRQWVAERKEYINKLIQYATERQIPFINVYAKSLTPKGDGDLRYINKSDYIHPSDEGIKLIEQTIADFIFQNKIFPN